MLRLPRYSRPPVVEVAISVTYEPLAQLGAVRLGQLWFTHFRDSFPFTEEHPPFEAPVERFGAASLPQDFQIQLLAGAPTPRAWFLSHDRAELLQVQSNWFGRNWRRTEQDQGYPSFDNLGPAFFTDFEEFQSFLKEEKLGDLIPTQCELTYINELTSPRGLTHSEPEKVLREFHPIPTPDSVAEFVHPESVRFHRQFLLGDTGAPAGRLNVTATPAFRRNDMSPIFVLQLTARGAPSRSDGEGVRMFLDMAHEAIVTVFTSVTTDDMHKEWGIENE